MGTAPQFWFTCIRRAKRVICNASANLQACVGVMQMLSSKDSDPAPYVQQTGQGVGHIGQGAGQQDFFGRRDVFWRDIFRCLIKSKHRNSSLNS